LSFLDLPNQLPVLVVKKFFQAFLRDHAVNVPLDVNVWMVLPPLDVTVPPVPRCAPAYEMMIMPEPPAAPL
jgi:hypothetical protein